MLKGYTDNIERLFYNGWTKKEYEEMSKRIKIHNHIVETKETDIKKVVEWLKQPHTNE